MRRPQPSITQLIGSMGECLVTVGRGYIPAASLFAPGRARRLTALIGIVSAFLHAMGRRRPDQADGAGLPRVAGAPGGDRQAELEAGGVPAFLNLSERGEKLLGPELLAARPSGFSGAQGLRALRHPMASRWSSTQKRSPKSNGLTWNRDGFRRQRWSPAPAAQGAAVSVISTRSRAPLRRSPTDSGRPGFPRLMALLEHPSQVMGAGVNGAPGPAGGGGDRGCSWCLDCPTPFYGDPVARFVTAACLGRPGLDPLRSKAGEPPAQLFVSHGRIGAGACCSSVTSSTPGRSPLPAPGQAHPHGRHLHRCPARQAGGGPPAISQGRLPG